MSSLSMSIKIDNEAELLTQLYHKKWFINCLRNKLYLEGKYPFSWYESVIAYIICILNIFFFVVHSHYFVPFKDVFNIAGKNEKKKKKWNIPNVHIRNLNLLLHKCSDSD